jgi:hypothetical protein
MNLNRFFSPKNNKNIHAFIVNHVLAYGKKNVLKGNQGFKTFACARI